MKSYLITLTLLAFSHCMTVRSDLQLSRPQLLGSNNLLEPQRSRTYCEPESIELWPSRHIVGGEEAEPHNFPYVVYIRVFTVSEAGRSTRVCGGSLISPEWVLTAAHCLQDADVVFATGGAHDVRIQEWTQQTEIVKQQFKHPNSEPNTATNDLALLRLERNLTLDGFVKTIRLPSLPEKDRWYWRSSVKTAGWGMSSKDTAWRPSCLRALKSTVITSLYCSWCYGFGKIKDYHICIDGSKTNSPYKGDSGSPLVVIDSDGQPTLIGVAAKDIDNGFEKSCPPIFTRVTHYLQWISNRTGIPLRQYP